MSVNTVQEQPAARQWETEDEIDLTRYIGALASRWPEILLTALVVVVVTAGAVLLYRWLTPPVYEATATAAIVRTSSDVVFDARFTTSSATDSLDVNSRRMALIAQVSSGEIAQQVIDELGEALPPNLRNPAELLKVVHGQMALAEGRSGQSDLINITAVTASPETSALIANTWAKTYVQQVNSIYGQVPNEMLNSIGAQLTEAQQTYEAAQQELEAYMANSQLDALLRQSDAISETLGVLQATQVDAVTSENDRLRTQLRLFNDQWVRTNGLLTAARALGDQVEGVTDADLASLALALQVLQVQMVNAAAAAPVWFSPEMSLPEQQPATLQLQLGEAQAPDAAALSAQVMAVIASLETQLAALQENIAQASAALDAGSAADALNADGAAAPLAAAISSLEAQRRSLQSQIEIEKSAKKEYESQRDLAWESLVALNNKQAEMLLTRAAANSEVRLSSSAVALDEPVEQVSLVLSVLLAGMAGVLLGVLLAFVLEVLNIPPLRRPRSAASVH